MSKHLVDHACGHPAEHALTGTAVQQILEAKRRAGGPCPVCYGAEVASDNALNALYAAEQKLPELAGSDKQVAWAVTLRADFLGELPNRMADLVRAAGNQQGAPALDQQGAALTLVAELAAGEVDSRWWIGSRGRLAESLIKRHERELRQAGTVGDQARRLLMWISTCPR